ncbi:MAG: DNA adenine methylase [Promethearchaeota archaeon]
MNFDDIRARNRENKTIVDVPHPFVKWAGGKRQLLAQIDPYLPESFNRYVEPFVGGGALFFYLLPGDAVLIDNNPVLVNAYEVVQTDVEALIESLQKHRNEKDYYYAIRGADRTAEFAEWSPVERASRTLYMNKCCYNGLYRVNSKGQFNVPFGKYKNPKFCDARNLRAAAQALQGVEVVHDSFERCLEYAREGDFVYLDPPYHPVSETANFTSYTKDDFGPGDQERLREVFGELDRRGCKVLLSNSHSEFILDLYSGYAVEPVMAKRAINSDASKRGAIREVLVRNYDP